MKAVKIFFAGLLLVIGAQVVPVQAQGLSYTKFHSDIAINNDASIWVTETIDVNFSTAHHGIFRNIPYRFATQDGGQASIPIDISGVLQDGRDTQYSTTTDGTYVKVKIGDANNTISGSHEYVIRYTAQAATNFFADHDELYWNVTGEQWDEPLSNVSATVRLPSIFPVSSISATCYTGKTGSTQHNCTDDRADSTVSFTSTDYLTIVVGWPTGFVTKPANFDQLRSQGTITPPNPAFQKPSMLALACNILAVVIVFGLMFRRWWMHGRDPKNKTIIAQYDPPDNLRPAELYAVMHEQAPMRIALPATIVDLAVRGYLQIREVSTEKFLGLGHQKDYELTLLKNIDDKLHAFEQSVLNVFFDTVHTPATPQSILRLSELKKRKYTSNPFSSAIGQVMQRLVSDQYFMSNPVNVKILYGFLGVAIAGISVMLISVGSFAWGGIVAGLVVLAFVPAMPQRSPKGAEAAWIGYGFRLFIEKAEQYRVKWQERENIFETFLPYAMVFGLADKWSKALADVAKQPDWYIGSSNQTFNTMLFVGAMSNFGSTMNSSVVSVAASGGSGFGGGGFSGGGGGGGGGGGW